MNIIKLKPNQIFCFGNNINGFHSGGAAKQAYESFGAKWGQPHGLQGQSYGIVTLDAGYEKLSLTAIQAQLYILNQEAKTHPKNEYLLTPIGTGIAGFTLKEIKSILPKKSLAKNIIKIGNWK